MIRYSIETIKYKENLINILVEYELYPKSKIYYNVKFNKLIAILNKKYTKDQDFIQYIVNILKQIKKTVTLDMVYTYDQIKQYIKPNLINKLKEELA